MITLTLTPQQAQLVVDALAELPLKVSAQTYSTIMAQIAASQRPPAPPAPPAQKPDELVPDCVDCAGAYAGDMEAS